RQPAINPFGQGTGPRPPPRDGYHPPEHLVRLDDLAAAGRRVTFRDELQSGACLLDCDQAVTDQTAAVVEEEKIPDLKLRRRGGLDRELIALPQCGGHARTGHPKAE